MAKGGMNGPTQHNRGWKQTHTFVRKTDMGQPGHLKIKKYSNYWDNCLSMQTDATKFDPYIMSKTKQFQLHFYKSTCKRIILQFLEFRSIFMTSK